MLLPKQQTQAEAWRLFFVSGSLTWLRRPRLASFTSTTHVETNHPLAKNNHCGCASSVPPVFVGRSVRISRTFRRYARPAPCRVRRRVSLRLRGDLVVCAPSQDLIPLW